jgi:hypothetical protein
MQTVPSPKPSSALRRAPEPRSKSEPNVEVQGQGTVIIESKQTIKVQREPRKKMKSPQTGRKKCPPATGAQRERPRPTQSDEDTKHEWKTSFLLQQERKNLGEKEYRIRTAKKNKEKVDQLMKSIKQSKEIQKEG